MKKWDDDSIINQLGNMPFFDIQSEKMEENLKSIHSRIARNRRRTFLQVAVGGVALSAMILITAFQVFHNDHSRDHGTTLGSDSNVTATELAAIAKARTLAPGDFPERPGTRRSGTIHGGGPVPGIQIPGVFETEVTAMGDNIYVVTFTEKWERKYFNGDGGNRSNYPIASHYWQVKVTSEGVRYIGGGGDFPPQASK